MTTDRDVLLKLYRTIIEKRKDCLSFAEETDTYFEKHPDAREGFVRLTTCPEGVKDDPEALLRFFAEEAPPEVALFYNMALGNVFLHGQDFGETISYIRALLKMGYYAALRDIQREELIV